MTRAISLRPVVRLSVSSWEPQYFLTGGGARQKPEPFSFKSDRPSIQCKRVPNEIFRKTQIEAQGSWVTVLLTNSVLKGDGSEILRIATVHPPISPLAKVLFDS